MDYEKKYNEALERARKIHDEIVNNEVLGFPGQITDIFPELCESEDERMLRTIIRGFENLKGNGVGIFNNTKVDDILAYLEKREENIKKEYVFRPLAGTDINSAAEQAIRRANEGDRLVLAFNGAYIPVRKGCNANEIVDVYDAFIEKQKEQKPKVDLVTEYDEQFYSDPVFGKLVNRNAGMAIARHFYGLGLKANSDER